MPSANRRISGKPQATVSRSRRSIVFFVYFVYIVYIPYIVYIVFIVFIVYILFIAYIVFISYILFILYISYIVYIVYILKYILLCINALEFSLNETEVNSRVIGNTLETKLLIKLQF